MIGAGDRMGRPLINQKRQPNEPWAMKGIADASKFREAAAQICTCRYPRRSPVWYARNSSQKFISSKRFQGLENRATQSTRPNDSHNRELKPDIYRHRKKLPRDILRGEEVLGGARIRD